MLLCGQLLVGECPSLFKEGDEVLVKVRGSLDDLRRVFNSTKAIITKNLTPGVPNPIYEVLFTDTTYSEMVGKYYQNELMYLR